MKVMIHDISNGNWEINELKLPLCNEYHPGLTSILVIGENNVVDTTPIVPGEGAPSWFGYIKFGLKMLWRKYVKQRY